VIHAAPRAGLALKPVEARPESPAARLPPYTAQRTAMGRTANSAVVGSMAAIGDHLPLLRGSTNAEKRPLPRHRAYRGPIGRMHVEGFEAALLQRRVRRTSN
jgi:hypothetical protein